MRESFLDWFRSYIASRPIPGRERVERAMRRAEWGLAHPLAERVRRRLRSALALETA